MTTFIMFGKYSAEAIKGINPKRTEEGATIFSKYGGKMKSAYALLGEHDLLIVADFPGIEQAMQCSVALGKATGIGFTTSPAVSLEEFDALMKKV